MSEPGPPHAVLDLVRRLRVEPRGLLADELGRFALVGEREDEDPDGWSFATTTMDEPSGVGQLGFDLDRGIVYAVRKLGATFADTVLVGRSRSNDIRIDHPSVSKLHARIRLGAGSFELEDAGSRNGTWHDTGRVEKEPVEVFPGDFLRFGSCRFVVHETKRLLEILATVED